MSSREFRARFGPFKGLTSAFGAYATPADAKVAENCDTRDGTLRGFYGPGTALDQFALGADTRFLHVAPGGVFISSEQPQWACDDAVPSENVGDAAARVTYKTALPTPGDPVPKPRVIVGANDYQLGLDKPQTSPTASGGSGSSCRYVVTFYCTATGTESNPDKGQSKGVSGLSGATLNSLPVYADAADPARATTVRRRIYRTQAGDPDGILYYCTEIANNTATTSGATPTTVDTTSPLDWGAGGTIDNDVLPYDHSPAPSLTVLSDSIHSVNEGQGAPGSGILFGAVDSWLTWSRVGYPMYWPTVNWMRFGERINAIVSWNAQTFVFTASGIFSVSGVADYALTITKTGASVGVEELHAKTVAQTPQGIVFLSREGLVLFDGNGIRKLSEGAVDTPDLIGQFANEIACGAYYDGFYFLSRWGYWEGTRGVGWTYVFDLRRFPDVLVTTTLNNVKAFALCTAEENDLKKGLYVTDLGGSIRPWRPNEGALVTGAARGTWYWESPALTLGEPEKSKRFMRVQVEAEGSVTLSFFIGDETTPRCVKENANGLSWVSKSLQGKSLRVRAEGTSSARLVGLEVRGEVRRV